MAAVVASADGALKLHQFPDPGQQAGDVISGHGPAPPGAGAGVGAGAGGRRRAATSARGRATRGRGGAEASAGDDEVPGVVGGSSVWVAVWESGEVAYLVFSLSYADLVWRTLHPPRTPHQVRVCGNHCVLCGAAMGRACASRCPMYLHSPVTARFRQQPVIDDVDTQYGLHDFSVNVYVRCQGCTRSWHTVVTCVGACCCPRCAQHTSQCGQAVLGDGTHETRRGSLGGRRRRRFWHARGQAPS